MAAESIPRSDIYDGPDMTSAQAKAAMAAAYAFSIACLILCACFWIVVPLIFWHFFRGLGHLRRAGPLFWPFSSWRFCRIFASVAGICFLLWLIVFFQTEMSQTPLVPQMAGPLSRWGCIAFPLGMLWWFSRLMRRWATVLWTHQASRMARIAEHCLLAGSAPLTVAFVLSFHPLGVTLNMGNRIFEIVFAICFFVELFAAFRMHTVFRKFRASVAASRC